MPGNRATLKTNKQPYSTKEMYTPDSVNNTYICKNASIFITKIGLLLLTLPSSGHACHVWGLCDVADAGDYPLLCFLLQSKCELR